MTENIEGQWAISRNGEEYYSSTFSTKEEAIAEGRANWGAEEFYVGQLTKPTPPENRWHADDWLEHVSVQDDYSGDHAEDWDMSTYDQREELEAEVRKVMAAWLDRHNLRPTFFNVENEEKIPAEDA